MEERPDRVREPISTYRLQVRESFDLYAVARLTTYLRELGADWLYLSPLLQAQPGSMHGYDVIDPSTLDAERGGIAGLDAVVHAAREAGLGILVDIVPNHMGVASPELNAWWWDLLTHGPAGRYAEAFDVDWAAADGKVRIPILGDGDSVENSVRVEGGELRYHDHRFPIAPGTGEDSMSRHGVSRCSADAAAVHSQQHYELVNWRLADAELNYRRFFAVNSLAGIRMEEPWVFDATHVEIARWFSPEHLADGLRVDHPDGLYDPKRYLERLRELSGGAYTVVEKILAPGEELPAAWSTDGTTGYDSLGDFDRVLVDPTGEAELDALAARLHASTPVVEWPELIHGTKQGIADGILESEVLRLARELRQEGSLASFDDDTLADAVSELAACFPVYRSYLPTGIDYLREATGAAAGYRPDIADALEAIAAVLADPAHPAAMRFQQTSGMVMAKGVEDTAFYRYTRLTSLNEVGCDPSVFSLSVAGFHERQRHRLTAWPHSMTTLTTHDTKRGEDVRARISVLAELPYRWSAVVDELRRLAAFGDGPLENLLWQAIIGSWPASRERLHRYAEKAAREAGVSTDWDDPDTEFEAFLHHFIDSVFDNDRVRGVLESFYLEIRPAGFSNSLSAKLLQLTAPGVPDVYQGSELWELSLVDPDNRRPVDFEMRRRMLREIDAGGLPGIDETGAAKLLVTHRALTVRRDRPELFAGYRPVSATGAGAGHVIAFDRGSVESATGGGAVTVATRLPIGLAAAGGWNDTAINLGVTRYREVLTGLVYAGSGIRLAELLSRYPVALLVPEGSA